MVVRGMAGIAAVVAVCGWPFEARAFDYVEHERISFEGVRLFLGNRYDPPNDPPVGQVDCSASMAADCVPRLEFLKTLPVVLPSSHLCGGSRLLEYAPAGCFALSDVPALAGDHAGTPLLLQWKWFNEYLKPQDPDPPLEVALRTVFGLGRSAYAPATSKGSPPAWAAFLRYIRRYSTRPWPVDPICEEGDWDPEAPATRRRACSSGDLFPGDVALTAFDSNYVSLAERGHPHFRPGVCGPTREWYAAPRTSDPMNPPFNAFAWYADLHAGAAYAARYAGWLKAAGKSGSEYWLGTAVLLEFYSLHFLEDAVAAGHMQMDATTSTNVLLSAVHDMANAEGVWVRLPAGGALKATAARASLPALDAAFAPGAPPARLFGDHQLQRAGLRDRGAALTFEWASALVMTSIQSVYDDWVSSAMPGASAMTRSEPFQRFAHAPIPCKDELNASGQLHADPQNGFPTCSEAYVPYCGVLAWYRSDNSAAIAELDEAEPATFAALGMVPFPEPLAGQSPDCADVNRSHTIKDFGGILTEAGPDVAVGLVRARTTVGGAAGLGLGVPPRLFPAEAFLIAADRASIESAESYLSLGARYRQFFGVDFPAFLQIDGAIGGHTVGGHIDFGASWSAQGGLAHRGAHWQYGASLGIGGDPVSGVRVPMAAFVTYAQ
ncbi:MAG TPA: hypothetical protein VKU41_20890 [Polyangiaceae bacterium]|nr:hypothetical protein [Polyangiaceae bacterium]